MFHPKVIRIYCYTEHLFDKTREGGLGSLGNHEGGGKVTLQSTDLPRSKKKFPLTTDKSKLINEHVTGQI